MPQARVNTQRANGTTIPVEVTDFEPTHLVEPVLPSETLLVGIDPNDPWRSASALRVRQLENTRWYDAPTATNQPSRTSDSNDDFTTVERPTVGYSLSDLVIDSVQINCPSNVDRRCIVRSDRKHGIESVKTE